MKLVFDQKGTFEAMYAAQRWCNDNAVSYGSSCVSGPVGLLRGEYCIAKWHNLNAKERAQLDGTMSGDMRDGPVTITMRDLPPNVELCPVLTKGQSYERTFFKRNRLARNTPRVFRQTRCGV